MCSCTFPFLSCLFRRLNQEDSSYNWCVTILSVLIIILVAIFILKICRSLRDLLECLVKKYLCKKRK